MGANSLQPESALSAHTATPGGSLKGGHAGQTLGVLVPGAFADVAVLDGDPLADRDKPVQVLRAFGGGVEVYRLGHLSAAAAERG